MKKNEEKDGRYERVEFVTKNGPETEKYSYKSELPLEPEKLEQLGEHDTYLRFVRFGPHEKTGHAGMIIDGKIDKDFALDVFNAIRKSDVGKGLFQEVAKYIEMEQNGMGFLLDLLILAGDAKKAGGKCNCPACRASRGEVDKDEN